MLDVNDNTPVFTPASYNVDVSELSQPGLSLLNVSASDADSGSLGSITYVSLSTSGLPSHCWACGGPVSSTATRSPTPRHDICSMMSPTGRFSLLDSTQEVSQLFTISSKTGEIVLAQSLDHDNGTRSHVLFAKATDGGSPPKESSARVSVALVPACLLRLHGDPCSGSWTYPVPWLKCCAHCLLTLDVPSGHGDGGG